MTSRTRLLWIGVLLLATALRLPHPDWDAPPLSASPAHAIAAHPDERFLLGVAQSVPLWGDICTAQPGFAYGHLPVYLARLLIITAPEADPLYAARLLSGLLGVLLVTLTGAFGRELGNPDAGLLAAAVMACAPFPLQQARFYTVDPLGASLASAAILTAMRRRWKTASVFAGLTLACKASLVWVGVVVAISYLQEVASRKSQVASRKLQVKSRKLQVKSRKAKGGSQKSEVRDVTLENGKPSSSLCPPPFSLFPTPFFLLIAAGLLAFALASPWALLRPVACWEGPLMQAGMVAGRFDFPYTRQYAGTWAWLYPLGQMALWGLGPLVTLLGVWHWGQAVTHWRKQPSATRVAILWMTLYFLMTAGLYVKFPRYLLPLYPVWVGVGSRKSKVKSQMSQVASRKSEVNSRFTHHVSRFLPLASCILVLLSTALLGMAQFNVYTQPHPWISASQWIYANVPAGATLAVEMWDHALPVPLGERDSQAYTLLTLPIFDEESPDKAAQLTQALEHADVIIFASRRGYGALARQPERYTETLAWYQRVLNERDSITFTRCPRLGPLALSDDVFGDTVPADGGADLINWGSGDPPGAFFDLPSLAERCGTPWALRLSRLDESLRVYDAPLVVVAVKR